jgi:hypothetical protein
LVLLLQRIARSFCGMRRPGASPAHLRNLSRALIFDAAIAIFNCGSDVQSAWRNLQKYIYDNK